MRIWEGSQSLDGLLAGVQHEMLKDLMATLQITAAKPCDDFRRYYVLATCSHDWNRATILAMNGLWSRAAGKVEQMIQNLMAVLGISFTKA